MRNSSSLSVFVCYYRQCSECDPSDDDDEMEVDTEDTTPISQGRQRRVIKEPTKFTPDKGEVSQVALRIRVANYFHLSTDSSLAQSELTDGDVKCNSDFGACRWSHVTI